jgi:hypothetical protein
MFDKFRVKNRHIKNYSGMCRRVGLVDTDVSEEYVSSNFRVEISASEGNLPK